MGIKRKSYAIFQRPCRYRSHGSWGAESDAYLMFFDLDAYDRFRMSKEERELLDEAEKEQKKQKKKRRRKTKKQ